MVPRPHLPPSPLSLLLLLSHPQSGTHAPSYSLALAEQWNYRAAWTQIHWLKLPDQSGVSKRNSVVPRHAQNRLALRCCRAVSINVELSWAVSHLWSNSASTKSRLSRVSERGGRASVYLKCGAGTSRVSQQSSSQGLHGCLKTVYLRIFTYRSYEKVWIYLVLSTLMIMSTHVHTHPTCISARGGRRQVTSWRGMFCKIKSTTVFRNAWVPYR